ncbi:hypothetical protein EYF80_008243 [Liparis tanakae]|uniref:Uncharacterized protein n=1 Tax=Liparis tanakae TaxID=230148 RepID=A0A4Z2IUI2_9TELE|nr:hypothetical protein EYF80_008243 [Liparis tanakae]
MLLLFALDTVTFTNTTAGLTETTGIVTPVAVSVAVDTVLPLRVSPMLASLQKNPLWLASLSVCWALT